MHDRSSYTIEVSRELADQYQDWTRLADVPADSFCIVPRKDGTAELWISKGARTVYAR